MFMRGESAGDRKYGRDCLELGAEERRIAGAGGGGGAKPKVCRIKRM